MGKWNPVAKQVREMEDNQSDDNEESVDELMETYNEIIKESKRSLTPSDVIDHLPENAKMMEGTLVIEDDVRANCKTAHLTQNRKEVLKSVDDGMNAGEIERAGIASQSQTSRTRQLFGFILEHPALKEAFLSKSRLSAQWELVDPESETTISYDSKREAIRDFKRFSQAFGSAPEVYKNGERLNVDSESDDSNLEEFSGEFSHPLDKEDWKKIIAALNRDEQDELASFIIDNVL